MAINATSPITGAPQTGFTAPTYTLASDIAPDTNGKQYIVTGLGGTQVGVIAHSVSNPFTHTVVRPKVFKVLPSGAYTNSIIRSVPKNEWKVITRKGVIPAVNQPPVVFPISTSLPIPAGADTNDLANIKAALSSHIGLLTQIAASLGDSAGNGSL